MTANVAVLQTGPAQVQESVVTTLREMLEAAERGDIVEVCAAVVYRDGGIASFANRTAQRTKRIGAVTQLLHDLLSAGDEA